MPVKKIFFLICGALLFYPVSSALAQDPRIPQVVPPAPDVAALQRYGDIPVSPYTGMPNISVPLYEIKSGDISVPISISYNASGIKVAEEASRVGLGWVLNAGGAISRNIIGKDDWDSYLTQTSFDIPLGPKQEQGSSFNFQSNCLQAINGYSLPTVLLNDFNSDFEPDQFSYNFNGHSGRFVLRRDGTVVLNKTEKLDIRMVDAQASAWEIKTPDGFLYRFQDIESFVDNTNPNRKSSWYLSKITSPTGRIVQFVYASIQQTIQPVGSYFELQPVGFPVTAGCTVPMPPASSQMVAAHYYHSLYLSKITFDLGEVDFNYSPGRVDVSNDVQLDDVSIFSKNPGGTTNTLFKSWHFNYSYFVGTALPGILTPSNPDLFYKRLRLVSLQLSSPTASLPPYTFSYNNDASGSQTLPAKLCFGRDHWGYFNGKVGNASLIPTYFGGGPSTIGAMGSERSADPIQSQIFTLNKITYPTGGSTQFDYESHDFDEPKSVINDHSFWANFTAVIPATVQTNFPGIQAGGTFTGTLDVTKMYPFSQQTTLQASFINTSGVNLSTIDQITYSLKDPSGTEISSGYISTYLGSTTPPMTNYLGTQQTNSGVSLTLSKLLTPGIYTWSFFVPPGLYAASVYIAYTKGDGFDPIVTSNGDTVYNALFGGGIRIKRITDYSDASTVTSVRKYNYHYSSNGKTYTYGRRMAKPNYSYYEIEFQSDCNNNCLMRQSDSNVPLNGSTNGVAVGYDHVEELFGENGENGKTVYEYSNQPDNILNYSMASGIGGILPLKPPYGGTIPDVGNGNLLTQTTYANIGGQFIKNGQTVNTYNDISDFQHDIVYGIDKRPVGTTNIVGGDCGMLSFYIYPALPIYRPVLISSVSSVVDPTGSTGQVSVTTNYIYNNTTHLQLTSKMVGKSNGDLLTTNYTYPADYLDAQCDAALLQMKGSAYMHALPVTEQVAVTKGTNQYLLNGSITRYQVLNNLILPKEKALLETNQPIAMGSVQGYNAASGVYPSGYTPRLVLDNYDNSGNLLQAHKSNDVPMTYIWDYISNYPIAQVKNAAITDVAATSFEADGYGNWNAFAGTITTVTAAPFPPTGNNYYNLTPSAPLNKSGLLSGNTYIISYWSKNGVYAISGGTTVGSYLTGKTINGWIYYEHKILATSATLTVSGTGAIDEARLYPSTAQMTTYTYAPLLGMTSQCDAENRVNYYFYDGLGRLKWLKDQDGNILKTIQYHYQGQSSP